MVITVTYVTGFGIKLVEIENHRQYIHVSCDRLLADAIKCKGSEENILLMLCLLLIFLCGSVVSEGIRIHLDFNV
jgi:hypothetical protein